MADSRYWVKVVDDQTVRVSKAFCFQVRQLDDPYGADHRAWTDACVLEAARIKAEGGPPYLTFPGESHVVGVVCSFTPGWYALASTFRVWLKQCVYDRIYLRCRSIVAIKRARSR